MNDLFLDTSYAVALASATDHYHSRALALAEQIKREKPRLVTTRAVLIEIGNFLARFRFRHGTVAFLTKLQSDPVVTIVTVSDSVYQKAFALYSQRMDKEWGMTDCISFVTMQERDLVDALTADEHFEQAGFRALLRHG